MKKDIDYNEIYEIDYIKNGMTMREISKKYKVSPRTVSKKFNELGLVYKGSRIDYSNININAFDTWSVEMAYWLGFFAADGSINKNTLCLALKSTDKEHLVKFKDYMNLPDDCLNDREIKHKKTNKVFKQSYLLFTSEYLVKVISLYGIVPSKSNLNIDFLKNINEKYKLPFILGYFDGDGFITFNIEKFNKNLGFVGNRRVIESIHRHLIIKYGLKSTKITDKSEHLSLCSWSSYDDIIKFIKLYKKTLGDYLPLNRKLELMNNFLDNVDEYRKTSGNTKFSSVYAVEKRRSYWPTKEKLEKLIQEKSFEEIGRIYNVSGKAVSKWCKAYSLPHKRSDIKIIYELEKEEKLSGLDYIKHKVKNSKVGFKNVYLSSSKNKPYYVAFKIDGKSTRFGSYSTAEEAARVADEKMIELFGEDAITNKKLGLL